MEEITIENEVRQKQEELIINQEIKNHLLAETLLLTEQLLVPRICWRTASITLMAISVIPIMPAERIALTAAMFHQE